MAALAGIMYWRKSSDVSVEMYGTGLEVGAAKKEDCGLEPSVEEDLLVVVESGGRARKYSVYAEPRRLDIAASEGKTVLRRKRSGM